MPIAFLSLDRTRPRCRDWGDAGCTRTLIPALVAVLFSGVLFLMRGAGWYCIPVQLSLTPETARPSAFDECNGMRLLIEYVRGRLAQAPRDLMPQVGGRIYERARDVAKLTQTKVFIRKGEVFFLNGALIRAHDSVNIEVMISDIFLMPSQIVSEDGLVSPLHKAYYFIQQMLVEPQCKGRWQNSFYSCLIDVPSNLQEKIQKAEQSGALQKALGIIRQEIKSYKPAELADGQ